MCFEVSFVDDTGPVFYRHDTYPDAVAFFWACLAAGRKHVRLLAVEK